MRCEEVLLLLSTMTIVSHGEDGTCASAENPPKKLRTVQSQLTNTFRAFWEKEILPEIDAKISNIEREFAQQISQLSNQLQVIISKHLNTLM